MRVYLSIVNVGVVFLGLLSMVAGAGTEARVVRMPGARVDLSTRNEIENALHLAHEWLVLQQRPEGWWQGTNTVLATSVALVAWSAGGFADHRQSRDKALEWLVSLDTHAATNLATQGWRLLAMAISMPDGMARSNLIVKVVAEVEAASRLHQVSERERKWWERCVAFLGDGEGRLELAPVEMGVAEIAAQWPRVGGNHYDLWQVAKTINYAGGRLARGDVILDWRADVARRLLATQRRDLAGGGYWDGSTPEERVWETLWAVMTLYEL